MRGLTWEEPLTTLSADSDAPARIDLMSVQEAADVLSVRVPQIYGLIENKVVRAVRVGKLYRINADDVWAILEPLR